LPSERIQRQINRLLDESDRAFGARDWALLKAHALDVLKLDSSSDDGRMFLEAAEQGLKEDGELGQGQESHLVESTSEPSVEEIPKSFSAGRYEVRKFLGEVRRWARAGGVLQAGVSKRCT
jgi:hypothetical protein